MVKPDVAHWIKIFIDYHQQNGTKPQLIFTTPLRDILLLIHVQISNLFKQIEF